jgi:hypothetical protein
LDPVRTIRMDKLKANRCEITSALHVSATLLNNLLELNVIDKELYERLVSGSSIFMTTYYMNNPKYQNFKIIQLIHLANFGSLLR